MNIPFTEHLIGILRSDKIDEIIRLSHSACLVSLALSVISVWWRNATIHGYISVRVSFSNLFGNYSVSMMPRMCRFLINAIAKIVMNNIARLKVAWVMFACYCVHEKCLLYDIYIYKYKEFCTMLLEEINGFCHGITYIFLLVGSYTMLSWQLIKEVIIAVYQHLNIKAQFNYLAYYSYVVDKIYAQGLADYAQKLTHHSMQAWRHLTLHSLLI